MKVTILGSGLSIQSNHGYMSISTITLLEYQDYKVIIDTGGYGQRNHLINTLNNLQICTKEITHVIFTHIHWDHFVNFDLFHQATFIIGEEEFKDLHRNHGRRDRATPHQVIDTISSIEKVELIQENKE